MRQNEHLRPHGDDATRDRARDPQRLLLTDAPMVVKAVNTHVTTACIDTGPVDARVEDVAKARRETASSTRT